MNLTRQLYELQETEESIASSNTALQKVSSMIGDRSALLPVEEKLDGEKTKIKELEKEQKTKEWEIDDLDTKISALNKQLYSGKTLSHKELLGRQQELEQLKQKKRITEDAVLELMEKDEALKESINRQKKELVKAENEWKSSQDGLIKEKENLEILIKSLEQKQNDIISKLGPRELALFKEMIESHGKAIAKVEQGRCLGCRIYLPAGEIQQVKSGDNIVYCSSCGRILYLPL